MGPLLGAEFLTAVGDPRDDAFASAGHLAAYAELVPAARDSGKRVGNNRRMRGGNKLLKKVLYQSAFSSLHHHETSRAFYDRKRRESKRHRQAVVDLARRQIDVLWAMMRDEKRFDPCNTKGATRQRTWEGYEQIARAHLKPSLGRNKLKRLPPPPTCTASTAASHGSLRPDLAGEARPPSDRRGTRV